MDLKKSQVIVLIILAVLLFIAHLLPSSMKPFFLYFIFNFLVISLGAEAGLLSPASSTPLHDKTTPPPPSIITHKPVMAHEAICKVKEASIIPSEPTDKKVILVTVTKPSLFFIACEETGKEEEKAMKDEDGEAEEEREEEESGGVINKEQEELCAKAEAFIGTFYKQLKMQREESWKKIHYQKAF